MIGHSIHAASSACMLKRHQSGLQRIVAPILQTPRRLAVRILLRLLLLGEVPLAIRDYATHVRDIVLIVLFRVLLGVLVQDLNDLAPAVLAIPAY